MTTEWFQEFGAPEGGVPRLSPIVRNHDPLDAKLARLSDALAKEHSGTSIGVFFATMAQRFGRE